MKEFLIPVITVAIKQHKRDTLRSMRDFIITVTIVTIR